MIKHALGDSLAPPFDALRLAVKDHAMDPREAALENFLVESIDNLFDEGFNFPLHVAVIGTNWAAQIWRYHGGGETPDMLAANREATFGFPINIIISDSLGKAAHLLIDREGNLSRLN